MNDELEELCECGRLYKSCVDKNGKIMCPACFCNCSIVTLKLLWSTPIPQNILKIFKKESKGECDE